MKWIDIKKNKPSNGQLILITNGQIITAVKAEVNSLKTKTLLDWDGCYFSGNHWDWNFNIESITHWLPLTDLPNIKGRYQNVSDEKEITMLCPYCEKEDFIPNIVFRHTRIYGSGIKNFSCLHCQKVIRATCSVKAIIFDIQKTDRDSDWA